ncbi:EscU/YscU/HrcU family type III secretion system export apparatus switch protein [Photobacterium leiognathi]|uniref:EscU/YscU/HrcU family type III secretion system export apparatus switch protein n=1 Tax=Photobacterium leiognathi TaxID=553611 RepID=UPI0034E944DF
MPHVLSDLGNMVANNAIIFGSVLLFVSFLDAPSQKFSHINKLKMSRKDMEDEYKSDNWRLGLTPKAQFKIIRSRE